MAILLSQRPGATIAPRTAEVKRAINFDAGCHAPAPLETQISSFPRSAPDVREARVRDGDVVEADRGHRASVSRRAAALSGANELDVVEPRPDSQHARDDLIPERVLGAHHQFDLVFTGLVPEARPRALPDRRLQLPLGPGGAPIEQQDEVPAEEALAVGALPVPAKPAQGAGDEPRARLSVLAEVGHLHRAAPDVGHGVRSEERV